MATRKGLRPSGRIIGRSGDRSGSTPGSGPVAWIIRPRPELCAMWIVVAAPLAPPGLKGPVPTPLFPHRGLAMRSLTKKLVSFLKREDGPTAVEYAVMLALIIVVCIAAITTLGSNANSTFSFVGSSLTPTRSEEHTSELQSRH